MNLRGCNLAADRRTRDISELTGYEVRSGPVGRTFTDCVASGYYRLGSSAGQAPMRLSQLAVTLATGLSAWTLSVAACQCQATNFNAEVGRFEQVPALPAEVIGQYEKTLEDLKALDELQGTRFFTFDVDLNSKTTGLFVQIRSSAICSSDEQCPTDLYDTASTPPHRIFSAIAHNVAVQTGDIVAAPRESYPSLLTNIPKTDWDEKTSKVLNPEHAKLWKWNGKEYTPAKW